MIIIVGPGSSTRGGITSVIRAHQSTKTWEKWKCKWISTYNDKNNYTKITHAIVGFITYLYYIPFCKIIHIHFSWNTSAKRKLPFFLIAKLFRKKTIIHLHSGSEPIITSNVKKIYEYFFKNADTTILLAKTIENSLRENFTFRRTIIIHNPCLNTPNLVPRHKENHILYAGHINDKKGIFDLLIAFSLISKKYHQWKLIIAGSGNISKLYSLINKYNINHQTEFLGWIKEQKKDDIFSNSSIFCLPSYTEGFPMAVLDAWSYGLPVITTPVGGLPDIINHGKNAMVFQPGDIESLSYCIEQLIIDKQLRSTLSEESIKLSRGIFSLDNISLELDNLYSTLLTKS